LHGGFPGVAVLVRRRRADFRRTVDPRAFLKLTTPFERVIVHGDTPVEVPEFQPNRMNLGAGLCNRRADLRGVWGKHGRIRVL
jgi:hypothetical protein